MAKPPADEASCGSPRDRGSQQAAADEEEGEGSEEVFDEDGKRKCKHKQRDERIVFKKRRSHASCQLSEITGFVYGGFSSRFWMLRKHINNITY